jgi:hypothetical protein
MRLRNKQQNRMYLQLRLHCNILELYFVVIVVVCSFYSLGLNRGIKTNRQFLSCATIALSERHLIPAFSWHFVFFRKQEL